MAITKAGAVPVVIDRTDGYFRGGGGEFTITGYPVPSGYSPGVTAFNGGFQSFCLEINSSLPNLPGNYNAVLNPDGRAIDGGVGSLGDPISIGTAWLYSQFAAGTLIGYRYADNVNSVPGAEDSKRASDALILQLAIYQLEGEVSNQIIGNNKFLEALANALGGGSLAGLDVDANGAYGVGVLNVFNPDGSQAQDQLVLLPDGGSAMILLGMGMTGLALISRKLRA